MRWAVCVSISVVYVAVARFIFISQGPAAN